MPLAAGSAQGIVPEASIDTAATASVAVPNVAGQWSDWSPCTQACGGLQKRVCSTTTGSGCEGPSMQFCNLLAQCPRMCTIHLAKSNEYAVLCSYLLS